MTIRQLLLVAALCHTWLGGSAHADPILTASKVLLPSGDVQWTIFFDGNDGAALSSAFDLRATSTSDFKHRLAFAALAVDSFGDAVNFDFVDPGYDMDEDTWVDAGAGSASGFTVALPSTFAGNNGGAGGTAMTPAGPVTTGTAVYASWGTPGGATQGPGATRVMQLILGPESVQWQVLFGLADTAHLVVDGWLARGGASAFPIELRIGIVPEPGSALLLATGVLGLVAARPRRRLRSP